jgi:tripartite-type tricarboxylate transporter receptor subunit TctC
VHARANQRRLIKLFGVLQLGHGLSTLLDMIDSVLGRVLKLWGYAMKFSRRKLIHLTAAGAVFPVLSSNAGAQTYPSRLVRIIVGFAAGSTTDILARLMGQWLSLRFGQQFIVENRPGAGGNVGAETVVNAPADGYTLLMVPPAVAANPTLYGHLSFNFLRDTTPVAGVVRVPNVAEVNPSVPVKTIPELIAYAKANAGQVSFASAGIGTASHLAGQLFNAMTGANLQHVPYRGDGPAMADLIAERYPIVMLRPSTKPVSLRPSRNAGATRLKSLDARLLRKPITGSAGC